MTKKKSPFDGAFEKGKKAAIAGMTLDDCPYDDKRKPSGKLSWSRAFQSAWVDGFRAATEDMKKGKQS